LDSSNFPAAAKAVPRVGDHQRLDIERIVALKPDVVLAWHHGNSERELEQIEAAGLRVVRLEPNRLADVPRAIERIGVLTGHDAQAMKSAQALRSELAALRLRYGSAAPVSVFFQVWTRPLMTLGGPQLISDVIGLCGGHNVFADLEPLAPQVSTEAVVAAAPQALLTTRQGHGDPADLAFTRSPADPVYAMWSPFTSIPAVRHGWMFLLPGDVLVRQGPRIAQGARAVCEALDVVRRERR
ncbi:MAG: cobalamin-binding protein, partial [Rhizobacter sp.]|nr:cobalamin-binding protein [Rhizobacter sp.]